MISHLQPKKQLSLLSQRSFKMSILVDSQTRAVCQGITGSQASLHIAECIDYGTKVVGGVTPGKGGQTHMGIDVFNTMKDAVIETGADTSIIFVPAAFCYDAVLEAVSSGVKLIICITEGVPVVDMVKIKKVLSESGVKMIGPNCPGIITPGQCKLGIMPGYIHKPGCIGIVSRSGTLTYEAVNQTTECGLGQSTCVGIGGDPIIGYGFVDILKMFEKDDKTEAVVMIGEIGGTAEEEAARYIKDHMTKPVIAYVAGSTAPKGKRMGHAGAIISGGTGTAEEKYRALDAAGVRTLRSPALIGQACMEVMQISKDNL